MFWLQSGGVRTARFFPNRFSSKPLICLFSNTTADSASTLKPATNYVETAETGSVKNRNECNVLGVQSGIEKKKNFQNSSDFGPSAHTRRFRMQLRIARANLKTVKRSRGENPSDKMQKSEKLDTEESTIGVLKGNEDLNESAKRIILTCGKTIGSNVKSPNEMKVSETETKTEDKPIHVNRFRKIVYTEGELDGSDFSMPPSKSNPHPFDPSSNPELLPPTHSRSIAQFVNHLPVLQHLVDLGVNLLIVEKTTPVGRHLVRLDWDKVVIPKLAWLINLGVPVTDLGVYLTRNPFFLLQDLDDMKARVNYLRSKKFTKQQIAKIVTTFRYWLNFDVRTVDARLGWIQKSFKLLGREVRSLVILEPRIIMFGIGPLQRLCMLFSEEFGFSGDQVKGMLLKEPRLFMQDASQVAASYFYLHFTMGLSNAQIVEYPLALRCPIASLRRRHEFLSRLKRDKYVPGTPDYVPLSALLHPSDKYFAVNVAKSFLASYNAFLKKI